MGALKTLKNHFVAWLGEFVGTFLFLFFAFAGTQTANQPTSSAQSQDGPNLNNLLYISLIFGFSLAVNVWVFFRVSGGLFNPAVTLALCITGVVPILRFVRSWVS
jgi:aquaporin related protein